MHSKHILLDKIKHFKALYKYESIQTKTITIVISNYNNKQSYDKTFLNFYSLHTVKHQASFGNAERWEQ